MTPTRGSSLEVFESRGLGQVRKYPKHHGSGPVTVSRPDLTREFDPTRQQRWIKRPLVTSIFLICGFLFWSGHSRLYASLDRQRTMFVMLRVL